MAFPVAEEPTAAVLNRLIHELGLRDELQEAWALRPLEIISLRGSVALVLAGPRGEFLSRLIGAPMEIGRFLVLATGIARALGGMHQRGLIHRDVKPAKIMVDAPDGCVRLTGFGFASRLMRERQSPRPPETIEGTLEYMAPEQTGRTNRSVDTRSDLYSLGVTLYQMVTGALPFTASDPVEWVHCHVAKKPVAPSERLAAIPVTISTIIMKLIAKAPEDRYQTASGIERDLQHCLDQWTVSGSIQGFGLGLNDTPDRLLIPEKLYGRDRESAMIRDSFDRVLQTGAVELLLVVGYSGVGKSAVIHELQKALVGSRALFSSSKFDQHHRHVPYDTLIEAFRNLVRPLLSKSDDALNDWREAFLEALGQNGRLITDLIPELKLIIGDQPPAAELPLQQAKVRFHSVFQRFIGVFAGPEHPLALFLDDLQWLDVATLDLLEDILTRPEVTHLLLIGAYRDNEVSSSHPLMRRLKAITSGGGSVTEISLLPLGRHHLTHMISEALSSPADETAALAALVHEKTEGNPFFAIQFLSMLADNGLLSFDQEQARWTWNVERIKAQRYTDNVVELMVEKLGRLPKDAQTVLQDLSCLGSAADIATLSLVIGAGAEAVDSILWPARRLELVERTYAGYRFTHDRIHEAAYSQLPDKRRAETHLRIGRLMLHHTPSAVHENAIFDIVNQLNGGAALVTTSGEREEIAELNLIAGRRAKASAAYASALNYFAAGAAMLSEQAWESREELAFTLALHLAECEFLTGNPGSADERLTELQQRVISLADLSAVTRLRGEIFVTLNRPDQAVAVALDYLRHVGTDWSVHPTQEDVEREYRQLRQRLDGWERIDALRDLPPMTDPAALATMEVLLQLAPAAVATDDKLLCVIVCRMANLSLEYGNSEGSCAAYVWLGMILGPYLGDYDSGFCFGTIGLELVERPGRERFRVRAYMLFGAHVNPWSHHVRDGRPMLQRAFREANEVGDVIFAGFSCLNLITIMLGAGDDLQDIAREVEFGLEYARDHQFSFAIDLMAPQLQLVRMLRGDLATFGHFDADDFDERAFEQRIGSLPVAGCFYWVRKLQARFLAGEYAAALDAAAMAEPLLWTSTSSFESAEYHFYAALAQAARHGQASGGERGLHIDALTAHEGQLRDWAGHCPENFANRVALVAAEIARIERRTLDAMHLYEAAIRAAAENGFIHHEALANELTARFYAEQGFETIARAYFRDARHSYLRWGAIGKVRALDETAPYALDPQRLLRLPGAATSTVESLDLATVIKVSQAISGETVLDRLVDTLMRTAMEHAGGEKAVLLLMDGAEHRIEAHAHIEAQGVIVYSGNAVADDMPLPDSVLRYVARVQESVVVDDARALNIFSDDPYFGLHEVRSLLCLPLVNRTQLIGLLYIENNLAARVFTTERLAVLKLIALQAAISLENARLYRDIEARESKIRRLVESDVIGIVIWDLDGRLLEANDAFLSMLQCDRSDLEAGLGWFDMTPPEWQDVHLEAEAEELRTTGAMRAREKEYFRKDGSRVPVLIGAAVFESQPDQGVAYILDLTDLKRAEAEARASEQRYLEAQSELAHANRNSTLGQLTGSIAHEVNQPITATVTNAQAALREIRSGAPDLGEIEEGLESIVSDGIRAGEIIARIRGLIKKSRSSEQALDVNAPIREVIALTRGEAEKNAISIALDLADGLPMVLGDKVQIQQVMLNLIVNAVEAMSGDHDGPRELRVSSEATKPGDVLVTVADTGPGLTSDGQDNVFEAFYTTKDEGLGMGLSISRSIIEAHEGQIWASQNLPRGAIFRFSLPRRID